MRWIDGLSRGLGLISAWLFFAAGLILTYEVLARYLFDAPTTWAAEVAQLFLIWGCFAAMAWLLHRRQHIAIAVLQPRLGRLGRRAAYGFSLCFIAAISLLAVWYGARIALDSFLVGRSTGTMLNIPNWWSEATIPLAFLVLLVQCLAEGLRLLRGEHDEEGDDEAPGTESEP